MKQMIHDRSIFTLLIYFIYSITTSNSFTVVQINGLDGCHKIMSLRVRLNVLITLLFVLLLLGASSYVISNARRAVSDEIQSTAYLTLQLVELVLASSKNSGQLDLQQHLLDQLAKLKTTRHMQIVLSRSSMPKFNMPPQIISTVSSDAPDWFVQRVKPSPMEFRRIFPGPDASYTEIIIRADPSDEITEVWYETRNVLIFLLTFIVLANLLVYFTLGRDLAPIEEILAGLDRIEQGDYRLRLPHFRLPELSRISDKFNHMAEVLLQSREENRHLTQRTLAIQEKERRHLAQELHDELGQSLTAIKAVAASIEQNIPEDNKAVSDNVKTIIAFSDRMYDVARNMMQRLRPAILDELGLITALQEMIDSWNDRHGDVFCHFKVKGELDNLGEDININLYRIVQESLTNIIKHAKANKVQLTLTNKGNHSTDESLLMTIRDDGMGFDITQTQTGLGLSGIRERVVALNGEFEIQTEMGKGVKIIITVPLKNMDYGP